VYLLAQVRDEKVRSWLSGHSGQAAPRTDQVARIEESLDRAVAVWRAPRVTFAFPRDLTVGAARPLSERDVALHPRYGHGDGRARPELVQPTTSAAVPDDLRYLRRVYEDLATIQRFAGATFGPPPEETT
jgi:hypothetical protein